MKYIILVLLPFFVYSSEQRVLLSGFTLHEHTSDRFGEKYNPFNYGVGYEYNFFNDYNELYFATSALLFNDSFENPQFVLGMGHAYRFDTGIIDIAVGVNGFIGVKKIYTDDDLNRDGGSYGFTGGVGPAVTLYYENMSVNFIYIPPFSYKKLDTTGFLFMYFGYKF
jgi:hypothetical protein